MGFFSSKKAEDNESYQVTVGLGGSAGDKSVVQVIRSRFYGKKGKEREDQPASYLGGVSAAQTLSSNAASHVPVASSPLANTSHQGSAAGPSILRNHNDSRPLPATPSTPKRPTNDDPPSPVSSRHPKESSSSSAHVKTKSVHSTATSNSRKNTDTVTVTLAQRLNELAMANSDGLLNDDEYRLLRQNLFERFASNAAVPTEAPVVPVTAVARPRPKQGGPTPERPTSRPLSNFQIEVPRPISINSRASATSGMVDLFRRATGRRSASKDVSDTSSVWSTSSNTSFFRLPRLLSKKSSNSSIRTNASRVQADTISISSRRLGSGSDKGHGDNSAPYSPSGSRSAAASIRRLATPPSSFPTRAIGQENRNTNSSYNVFDEDHLKTVHEINQEILNVEAEARRLMDAFNGLEVTTLARSQRHHVRPSLKSADFGRISGHNPESSWGVDSDGRSQRRINLADDAISLRSATSASPSTSASISRSAYSTKKVPRTKSTLASSLALSSTSRPGSLHRKNSSSSVTSERKPIRTSMAPPVPALPNSFSHGYLKGASSSNLSLARSTGHPPMNTVPEDEKASMSGTLNTIRLEPEDYENEMDDIRRRREEVSHRYDARLEYLRAKLKGAQLHEKLMRK
ncbi:hypothetical protein B0H34DRAFT_708041 [Crassisporium funariophilum]|nr:hypothetical protein B0H34DRAFT_708041 [Crassisporium funariophilum]